MQLLDMKTQELFETLWFHKDKTAPLDGMRSSDCGWIQYHTAKWCGPCKRLDIPAVIKAAEEAGLAIWKIDIDENDYTSGYCGIRTFPTWQFCVPQKIISTIQQSDTAKVVEWITTNTTPLKNE